MDYCGKCGTQIPAGFEFCGKCGTKVGYSTKKRICSNKSCGNVLDDNLIFCDKCGTKYVAPVTKTQDNSKNVEMPKYYEAKKETPKYYKAKKEMPGWIKFVLIWLGIMLLSMLIVAIFGGGI